MLVQPDLNYRESGLGVTHEMFYFADFPKLLFKFSGNQILNLLWRHSRKLSHYCRPGYANRGVFSTRKILIGHEAQHHQKQEKGPAESILFQYQPSEFHFGD